MSHGGMGSGGSHGHCHHGGHGGGAAFGMHADQSPSWNMAMQVERGHEELGKRLTIADPRVVIGLTLFVFMTLLSLPYTLDYFQSQGLQAPGTEQKLIEEASGPSPAALAMVGTTLMGGHVELPEGALERLSGAHNDAAARKNRIINDQHTRTMQSAPAMPSLADQAKAAEDAALDAYAAPAVAEKSANETVEAMLEASGMRNNASAPPAVMSSPAVANVPTLPAMAPVPASFGTPLQSQQQQPGPAPALPQAPGLTMLEYGGAVRGPNQQYYVYIPNQHPMQANANYGQPLAMAAQPAAQQMIAPQQFVSHQQFATRGQLAMAAPNAASSGRSAFNPDTSAVVAPLGMRSHAAAPTVPLLPSGPGQDGSQRMRVWVSR